jgi:parallel beta-helix repeat protein
MKKITSRTLLLFISISLITSICVSSGAIGDVNADSVSSITLTASPVIRVNNDTELASLIASEHWNGSGSASNPFIIENLDINATGNDSAIYIGNTTAHLIIRGCSVYGATKTIGYYHQESSGILLNNVRDCTVYNNSCSANNRGIALIASSINNIITNNSCNGNSMGITLMSSSNNSIENNHCNGNGLMGISLYLSDGNSITNNDCVNNGMIGINLYGSTNNGIMNNNFSANTMGVLLSSLSNYNKIMNNKCNANNPYGLFLTLSSNNTISSNICNGNTIYGIILSSSSKNIVSNNNCNSDGIIIDSNSSDNNLFGNIGNVTVLTDSPSDNNLMWVVIITVILLIFVIVFVSWGKKPKTQ